MFNLNSIVLLTIVVIDCGFISVVDLRAPSRSSSSLSCERTLLKNGYARYRERKSASRSFTCYRPFKLHGARYSKCTNGRWNEDMPICIRSGCDTVQTPNNSIIEEQNGGASISLHCMYGFQLVGNKEAYCDGLRWDRILGTCRLADSATRTECDFEAADQCGWENDLENSYDWKRRNGFSTFNAFESGPTHDHTSGKPLMGHYMVAEATGTRNTQVARLVSPIYNHTISTDACFRMFSHMYGATVGDLNVYLKPEGFTMTTLKYTPRYLLFHKQGNFGNRWVEDSMRVVPISTDFQIVIEAKPINGVISDIAIDDVALLSGAHCTQFTKNETDAATEEPDGVYNVMSCVNRCNETESVHNSTIFETDMMTGKQVEVCDCHDQCGDLETCCPDYNDNCLIDSTDAIDTTMESDPTTPASSMSMSTSTSTSTSTSRSTSTTTSTIPSTSTSTIASTSSSTSTSTTISTSTVPLTSTTTTKPKSSTPTTTTKAKTSTRTTTTKPKTIPIILDPPAQTSTKKSVRVITTEKTTSTTIVPSQKSTMWRINGKMAQTTANPTTASAKDHNQVSIIILSLLIATVLSVVCLAIYLLINKKWKPYNIDAIEFKTKYYSNKVEEPLLEEIATIIVDRDRYEAADVIATPSGSETNTPDAMVASKPKKKSTTKTKSKNHSKCEANEDVSLLEDQLDECYEEQLCFAIQSQSDAEFH